MRRCAPPRNWRSEDISAEVIDLATLSPLDMDTILESVAKTGRLVIVHEAARNVGVGAEIAALVAETGCTICSRPPSVSTGSTRSCPCSGWNTIISPACSASSMPCILPSRTRADMSTFRLPDLGEGLAEAEIVEWHVKVGDQVRVDQPMVSVETAKAVVEVPAPFSGVVAALRGAPGDIVPTGAPLIDFDSGTVVGSMPATSEEEFVEPATAARARSAARRRRRSRAVPAARALAKQLGPGHRRAAGQRPRWTW